MYEIGLSTTDYINEERFKEYQEAGIKYIEISVRSEDYDNLSFQSLKSWSEKYNVKIWSFHLPFCPFEKIDISKPELKDESIRYLCHFIDEGAKIGIDKFVIHASGEPIEENDRKSRMECAKKSLYELCEYARERNAVIAVEDLPRTCLGRDSSDMLELLSAHKDLKSCLDTNHLLNEDLVDYIKKIGNRIITTHISDYDKVNERHWLPGEGIIDWQEVLKALKEINYKGIWLYEIDFECPGTIIRERSLNCFDFIRNANEIFENKQITIFSRPKPNLGYWS